MSATLPVYYDQRLRTRTNDHYGTKSRHGHEITDRIQLWNHLVKLTKSRIEKALITWGFNQVNLARQKSGRGLYRQLHQLAYLRLAPRCRNVEGSQGC